MSENSVTIAGIDIGCSCVKCLIAIEDDQGNLEVAGVGIAPCSGHVREGVIVNASRASEAVRKAVEEAEETSGLEAESAFVSITGLHVRGILGSSTMVLGDGRSEEPDLITEEDVAKVKEAAGNMTLPSGCRVLERIPRDYSFEGFHNLAEPPVGLRATSVQARVYTIYADRIAVDNLIAVVENAGVSVEGVIPAAIASAEAVLNRDEKTVGTAVIDIGASSTDLVVYSGGAPVHLSSFSMGGDRITADIQSLGISIEDAARLKEEQVTAMKGLAESKTLSVRKVGGRGTIPVNLPVLSQIAYERVGEMLRFTSEEIAASGIGFENLTGGIVVTGGTARMNGILQASSEISGHLVEPGIPRGFTSGSKIVSMPEMATAVGLLKHGALLRSRNLTRGKRENCGNVFKKFTDFLHKLK